MIQYDNLLATSELQNIELLYNYAWYLTFDDELANQLTLETVSAGLGLMASNETLDNSKLAWFKLMHQILRSQFKEQFNFYWDKSLPVRALGVNEHPLEALIFPNGVLDQLDFDAWQESLSHLTPEQRVFILLNDIEQFNYLQIGEILGLSIYDVSKYLYHARQIFHQLLQKSA